MKIIRSVFMHMYKIYLESTRSARVFLYQSGGNTLNNLLLFTTNFADFVLVYEEEEKAPPPKHLEQRQKFLENLAKSQLEFEEVKTTLLYTLVIEIDFLFL